MIYDSGNAGAIISGPRTNSAVAVSNGLFTAQLDFGTGVFDGNARWLEIAVRPAGGGAFTSLAPRQPITPAPYAIFAANSGTGSGTGPWQLNNGTNAVYTSGNVGIGTSDPQSLLNVNGTLQWGGTTVDYAYSGEECGGLFVEQAGSSPLKSGIRLQSSKSSDYANYSQFLLNSYSGFSFMGLGTANGDVGIGTTIHQAKLDVRGDVRLGASGELRATSGEENLRIVRGVVAANGNIIVGSGFTVPHPSIGRYTITFNTPFAGAPTVTATAYYDGSDSHYSAIGDVTRTGADVAVFRDKVDGTYFVEPQASTFHFIAIGPR